MQKTLPSHTLSSAPPWSHNKSRRRRHTGKGSSRHSWRLRMRYARLGRCPRLGAPGAPGAPSPVLLEPDGHFSPASPHATLMLPFQQAQRRAAPRTTNRTRRCAWRPRSLADSARLSVFIQNAGASRNWMNRDSDGNVQVKCADAGCRAIVSMYIGAKWPGRLPEGRGSPRFVCRRYLERPELGRQAAFLFAVRGG